MVIERAHDVGMPPPTVYGVVAETFTRRMANSGARKLGSRG